MRKFLWFFLMLLSMFSGAFGQTLLPSCNANGTCNGQYTMPWGYCQWQSYQTTKTFTVAIEIGINSGNVSDACWVPFALNGGVITSMQGNSNYTPWAQGMSSMFISGRACTGLNFSCNFPNEQEYLFSQKYTAKLTPQSLPINNSFPNGVTAKSFLFVFNDDMAKPTTISVTLSGTFQQGVNIFQQCNSLLLKFRQLESEQEYLTNHYSLL